MLDGTVKSFCLENWTINQSSPPLIAVGRWIAPASGAYGLPGGSFSWGVWPLSECPVSGGAVDWGAYRVHAPSGELLRYRFDCVERAEMLVPAPDQSTDPVLRFYDLLLDFTVDPKSGAVAVLDEDEVAAATADGTLSVEQQAIVARFKERFLADHSAFTDAVDAAIAHAQQCT